MLLPTASTPPDTSARRPGTRRLAGPLVRSIEARLRQLNSGRSAEISHNAAATSPERRGATDSRLTAERTRDTSLETTPLATR